MTGAIAGPQRLLLLALATTAAALAGVRDTAVLSKDGGRNWRPYFDILFVKTQAG